MTLQVEIDDVAQFNETKAIAHIANATGADLHNVRVEAEYSVKVTFTMAVSVDEDAIRKAIAEANGVPEDWVTVVVTIVTTLAPTPAPTTTRPPTTTLNTTTTLPPTTTAPTTTPTTTLEEGGSQEMGLFRRLQQLDIQATILASDKKQAEEVQLVSAQTKTIQETLEKQGVSGISSDNFWVKDKPTAKVDLRTVVVSHDEEPLPAPSGDKLDIISAVFGGTVAVDDVRERRPQTTTTGLSSTSTTSTSTTTTRTTTTSTAISSTTSTIPSTTSTTTASEIRVTIPLIPSCSAPIGIANVNRIGACEEGMFIEDGGMCTAHCAAGFYSTVTEMKCSGWNLYPEVFECLPMRCKTLPVATIGQITCASSDAEGVVIGTKCNLACPAGYRLHGARTFSCFLPGGEDDPIFEPHGTCKVRVCGSVQLASPFVEPVSKDNGLARLGDQREVKCMDGYRWQQLFLKEEQTITCAPRSDNSEAEVFWKTPSECVLPRYCGQPPPDKVDEAAVFTCRGAGTALGWREGDVCSIECSHGFQAVMGGALMCQADGSWTGNAACFPQPCKTPSVYNGSKGVQNGFAAEEIGCPRPTPGIMGVPDGGVCSMTCKAPYSAKGQFVCRRGSYAEIPSCFTLDTSTETVYQIVGELELKAKGTWTDAAILDALQNTIAEGLEGVSASDIRAEVTDAKRVSRRLTASRSGLWELQVDYGIVTKSQADADMLLDKVAGNSAYANELQLGLEIRVPGVQVSVTVGQPRVQATYEPSDKQGGDSVSESSDDGGGGGAAIPIAIGGAVIGLILVGTGVWMYLKRRKHDDDEEEEDAGLFKVAEGMENPDLAKAHLAAPAAPRPTRASEADTRGAGYNPDLADDVDVFASRGSASKATASGWPGVGDKVEACDTSGRWCAATVSQVRPDGRYLLKWDHTSYAVSSIKTKDELRRPGSPDPGTAAPLDVDLHVHSEGDGPFDGPKITPVKMASSRSSDSRDATTI